MDDAMNMSVIKRLAPNYWLGYYAVYLITLVFLLARHSREVFDWSGSGYILTLAAIYAVSAGTALTAAIITEGAGYVILLIPKRIKKLKDEGRKEGREEGREEGRMEEREHAGKAVARFERGEITLDELRRLVSGENGYRNQD